MNLLKNILHKFGQQIATKTSCNHKNCCCNISWPQNFFCYFFAQNKIYQLLHGNIYCARRKINQTQQRLFYIPAHTHTLRRSYNNFHASSCNCNTTYRKLHYQKLKRNTIILKPDKKYLYFQMQATHSHTHTHTHEENK